jgi:hypothetical protein
MAILQATEVIITYVDSSELVFATVLCGDKEFMDVCLGHAELYTADKPDVEFPEDDTDGYYDAMEALRQEYIELVQDAIEGIDFVYDEDSAECRLADA